MKAVILAAGEGTRMRPLTDDTPKPLLSVAGKPVIQYTIDALEDAVNGFVVVAGYRKQQLKEYLSDREDVTIVEQQEALGTADAALKARDHIDGRALIVNGDDVYGFPDLEQLEVAVLVSEVEDVSSYGVVETSSGLVKSIEEKPGEKQGGLVNTGCYLVEQDFFELLENVEESVRGEYEITEALESYIKDREVSAVEAPRWLPCSYPWQLLEANEVLMQELEKDVSGEVAEDVDISGGVVVEEGAEVKPHSVIEGPAILKSGSVVGPHAHVRPGTVVHENARVGRSEVKNSVIGENSAAPHFNYVGDSYLGKDVNLGAGTKTANMRNDSRNVQMEVKGELMDTGRRKLGVVIGSGARLGVNCSIKPGRKIGSNAVTDSSEKIDRNVPGEGVFKDGELVEDRD